jgi:hypothetical protein
MTVFLITFAVLLIAFAALCMFGLPYMLMGPRMFDQFVERREQQIMAAGLLTAAISLVLAPFVCPGLISDASQAQVIAETLTGFIGRG